MSGEAVDYLIGLVITGIVAVSAIAVVPNMSYVSLLSVNQQQLRNVAMDTLKAMLLDAGYPRDWGSLGRFSNSSLQRFGLALDHSTSFYVLDPNKVSRLLLDNPTGHLGYETIRSLMNLHGYGFNLRIVAPFIVTINRGQPVNVTIMIRGVPVEVKFNDGGPISNAVVKAQIMYLNSKGNFTKITTLGYKTDALGGCTIAITDPGFQSSADNFVAIFYVTVADLSTVTATACSAKNQQVAQASIVGDNVTLSIPTNVPPQGARWVESVVAVTSTDAFLISGVGGSSDDKMNAGASGLFDYWSHQIPELLYDEVLFMVFTILAPNPRGYYLFLAPYPNWMGARIQAYGDSGSTARWRVKVQRDVIISGMTYVAELVMWKESP